MMEFQQKLEISLKVVEVVDNGDGLLEGGVGGVSMVVSLRG